jgi:hypothetical protein
MKRFVFIALLSTANLGCAEAFKLTQAQAERFLEYTNHTEDTTFWRAIFSNQASNLTEETFAEHLSIDGRQEIYHHIHYDEHVSPLLLNTLVDFATSYVQHCEDFLSDPLRANGVSSKDQFRRTLVHWQVGLFQETATRLEIDRSLAEKLFRQVKPPNFWVGHALARNPNTPSDILENLSGHQFNLALDLTLNPYAPTNILWRLLTEEKVEQARVALASRSTTDAGLLLQWATNSNDDVRVAIGRNTNAPTALLVQLTNETNAEVRIAASFGLASSPNTPLNILQGLARNGGTGVQIAVARNPAVSWELLQELLNNRSYLVWIEAFRVLASKNPPPKELLRKRLQAADGIEHRWLKDDKGLAAWVYKEL